MEKTKPQKCLSLLLAVVLCLAMLPFAASAESFGDFEYDVLGDGTAEITAYTGSGGDVEIPAELDGCTVTSLADRAFYDCTSLESVTIPDTVTSIGWSAFEKCTNLTDITIPHGVTSISNYTFRWCEKLKSVTIPDSVTSINGSAFSHCTSLASITIPESVTNIEGSAFSNCTSLTSVTIPKSITKIISTVFYNCTSLASVTLPGSITRIGAGAFGECGSLAVIYYYGDEASWNEITVYDSNEPLLNAHRIYIGGDEEIYTTESVSVIAPASALEESAVLKADLVGAENLNIADTQEYNLNNALIYDIYFEKDEQRVQPGATVTVYVPVPEALSSEICKVLYVDEETGSVIDMNAENESGFAAFTAERLGLYALVGIKYTPGDVNSDGKVDSADATLVLQFYAGIIDENTAGYNNSAADLNGDGEVTAADATLILQIYAGIA